MTRFFVFALGLAGCQIGACTTCPDLAYPGLRIRTIANSTNPTAASQVTYDIEQTDARAGEVPFTKAAVANGTSPSLKAGRYKFTFRLGAEPLGVVADVCTLGSAVGCAAEEIENEPVPELVVDLQAATPVVRLEKNGKCR